MFGADQQDMMAAIDIAGRTEEHTDGSVTLAMVYPVHARVDHGRGGPAEDVAVEAITLARPRAADLDPLLSAKPTTEMRVTREVLAGLARVDGLDKVSPRLIGELDSADFFALLKVFVGFFPTTGSPQT